MSSSKPMNEETDHWSNESPTSENDIIFMGSNIPGVYSSMRPDNDDIVTEPTTREELDDVAREPGIFPASTINMRLCVVTQTRMPLSNCSVLKISSDDPAGPQLARAWGIESASSLRSHLSNSLWNKMALRIDFIAAFESVYGGQWALVPRIEMLQRISESASAGARGGRISYLDEFPNGAREFEYIPIRSGIEKFLRFSPGVKDQDGTTSCSMHTFPFQGLRLRSNAHPFFAIANAAQKVRYAREGRSDIEILPYEQQYSLNICVSIYEQWLKQGKTGSGAHRRGQR